MYPLVFQVLVYVYLINQNDNFHPVLKIKLSNKTKYIKQNELSDKNHNSPDLIVIATNSKGLNWCPEQLRRICLENRLPPILLLTKGLNVYNNQYELLAEKLQRLLLQEGFDNINISVVGGPCLARDLANKIHSSVVIANKDLKIARWLQELLRTNYYHISITNDIIGVEVCAAIKNIFSMAIGSAKNLNTAAGLIQQSIKEMIIFTEKLKGKKETVIGLAGVADLYVSADGGRNSKMGEYLGDGMTFKEAKKNKMPNDTVEGADLAIEIGSKVRNDFNIDTLPLMISVINSICDEKKLKIDWNSFN